MQLLQRRFRAFCYAVVRVYRFWESVFLRSVDLRDFKAQVT